ncbi:hypothetical protein VO56_00605 [Mycoplasmopsis gallinacea]|uniref:DUF3137 domain-containing protein n=1 Tax=Mycoplasmopsis gallinacea TaxID=29556 RepID=A0A0D5ZJE0_9BACT|nr:hypothetical protein VO56_00605 [Mycoplasmopsis gallinacea]
MRIIKDPMSSNEFFAKFKEEMMPFIKENVEKAYKGPEVAKARKGRIIGIVAVIAGFFFLILAALGASFAYNSTAFGRVVLIISLIGLIASIVVAVIFFWIYKKNKDTIKNLILRSLNEDFIYNKTFQIFGDDFNYLTREEIGALNSQGVDTNLEITKQEMYYHNVSIPSDAKIIDITPPRKLLLHNKYMVVTQNVLYRWIEGSGKNQRERNRWNSYIKVDTSILQDRQFNFTLFRGNNPLGAKVKLENDRFNKIFKLTTNNELKIRQMYTPLAMETSVSWYDKERKNVKFPEPAVSSIASREYVMFSNIGEKGFMNLDFAFSVKSEKVFKAIVKDIYSDSFSFYYLIAFLHFSLYL